MRLSVKPELPIRSLRQRSRLQPASEAREEALVLRNKRDKRLSWEDTFKDMAREREDWSDFEGTVADGLDPAERW